MYTKHPLYVTEMLVLSKEICMQLEVLSSKIFWPSLFILGPIFRCPKMGLWAPESKKRRPLFHANTPPKWWTRYLFHVFTSKSDFWPFYWFWIFWLRFQLFLHCKNPQNWNGQQTIVYGSINLKFFLGGPDTYTKLPCEERSPNPIFFFLAQASVHTCRWTTLLGCWRATRK